MDGSTRARCRACAACLLKQNCGHCRECLEKVEFGGKGLRKKICRSRKCMNMSVQPANSAPPLLDLERGGPSEPFPAQPLLAGLPTGYPLTQCVLPPLAAEDALLAHKVAILRELTSARGELLGSAHPWAARAIGVPARPLAPPRLPSDCAAEGGDGAVAGGHAALSWPMKVVIDEMRRALAPTPAPLAPAPAPPPPEGATPHCGSPFDDLLLSGSATPPLLQKRPTPGASVPPPSMPPSPPAMRIPLRLDVAQYKPVQLSLALAVMFAARLAELDTTNPSGLLAAAGFGLLALANLAHASPRFLARAMTLVLVCAPTLRLVRVLVRSPEAMARDLDKLAGIGRCVITMATATGAAFGALPPSALPPTRKLLAVGYCACASACVNVILRVRTGDERAPNFHLLHIVLPFFASFLAAHAASRSSFGQNVARQNVARRGYSTRLACDESRQMWSSRTCSDRDLAVLTAF
ncbi:hypothetical protein EMIHUDRAFT_223313 [Emiliania huxleyi CCMP1516]|uniref:CXXC-type domain-containing protein n=2 Tax=Emiliania huxleyi TaxID=2903 RepID=A0A0D3KVK0_EMIH1|nr:hypothetical protein EMIHUDRAFT_223313 [Emiliania huxleyi CCMP1516]EOD39785.1 hypothetical protein EMIHUDRAFT_223313 [Emiliania huxleyi CCMP1516]|eukprot:XP_005792214.1 hypothetical protein EMIHUDRAFT_223313 [Emiliania huxleyi CCMP1516]